MILSAHQDKEEIWRFWDFGTVETNYIEDWYQAILSEEAQLLMDAMLKDCSKTRDHLHWSGYRGYLKGDKYKEQGIWELGFLADKRQYRILGIFAGKERAILLLGCYHKQKVYTPTNALDTALKRAISFREGRVKLYERKIEFDI